MLGCTLRCKKLKALVACGLSLSRVTGLFRSLWLVLCRARLVADDIVSKLGMSTYYLAWLDGLLLRLPGRTVKLALVKCFSLSFMGCIKWVGL